MNPDKKPLNLKVAATKSDSKQNNPVQVRPWRLLIVDDEEDVHGVTRLILAKTLFKNRPIELLSAYSAAQAKEILQREPDIAAVLLDVVMETDDAGLLLVHEIRQELNNKAVRIILRTGQPGQAPEERVIVDYDINDYKAKSELTAQKLFTTVIAALRSYETIISLEKNRAGLEKILNSSDSLFHIQSMQEFASGILVQISSFLNCQPEGILCLEEQLDSYPHPFETIKPCHDLKVIAGAGKYAMCLACDLGKDCYHRDIADHIKQALREHKNQFDEQYTVLYLETSEHKAIIAIVNTNHVVDDSDQKLLAVFASKIAIALANALHYQKMISFQEAATTDFLTGLHNRRQLLRLGISLIALANRVAMPVAVAMLDVDYFKRVNDSYGHDVGDIVLQQIGLILKKRFRSSDIIARYGGEEFCIISSQLQPLQAFKLFDEFRATLEKQVIMLPNGTSLNVTVSIGVSTQLRENLDDMIIEADHLLYAAKAAGRNRVMTNS